MITFNKPRLETQPTKRENESQTADFTDFPHLYTSKRSALDLRPFFSSKRLTHKKVQKMEE
uniref:Uncharacterized protein n=1 Tax=Romanomermis culicivorax TaxID=13658 RepID=A0A915LAJ8_ROMCU